MLGGTGCEYCRVFISRVSPTLIHWQSIINWDSKYMCASFFFFLGVFCYSPTHNLAASFDFSTGRKLLPIFFLADYEKVIQVGLLNSMK